MDADFAQKQYITNLNLVLIYDYMYIIHEPFFSPFPILQDS